MSKAEGKFKIEGQAKVLTELHFIRKAKEAVQALRGRGSQAAQIFAENPDERWQLQCDNGTLMVLLHDSSSKQALF